MKHDLIIIGAGAAGLMAAISASDKFKKILVLEKTKQAANKIKISGNGRCNVSNTAPINEFIEHFDKNGKFLYRALSIFSSKNLIEFLKSKNVDCVIEDKNRIFPKSNSSNDVVSALVGTCIKNGVVFEFNSRVTELCVENNKIVKIFTEQKTYNSDYVILASGGLSYPHTGCTGDGYKIAEKLGHKIIKTRPALVALKTKNNMFKMLQGLTLPSVNVNLFVNGKKTKQVNDDVLFTHKGVSGPAIFLLSKYYIDAVNDDYNVKISLDFCKEFNNEQIDEFLIKEINENGKKMIKKIVKQYMPISFLEVFFEIINLDQDKLCNQINSTERKLIAKNLKNFDLNIVGNHSIDEAIVTAGGICLKQVDAYTMKSKIIDNLYFAGEILDLDADTGGYNLQSAFSTGWLAGCIC